MNPVFHPDHLPLDPANPLPRYVQVKDWLEKQIRSGVLEKGLKLPAEKEWAPLLGVSQMTLNHAIQALVKDGIIVREIGRGTFVADPETNTVPAHIGLVLHWQKDSDGGHYGSTMLSGIYHTAANRPAKFSFTWGSIKDDLPEDYYVDLAADMNVDGLLLLIPPARALPQIEYLKKERIPFMVIGASWSAVDIPAIDFDNAGGATLSVRHLLELGHRNIGIVNGAMHLCASRQRTAQFHKTLMEAGITPCPDCEVTSPSFQMNPAAVQNMESLLRAPDGPTAWFAAGYYLTMQTVDLIQGLGLRIPDDVSVVGFGDPYTAAYMSPPLSTVRHPIEALGELAANRLLDDVARGVASSDTDILPVEFIPRNSTAPPRQQDS